MSCNTQKIFPLVFWGIIMVLVGNADLFAQSKTLGGPSSVLPPVANGELKGVVLDTFSLEPIPYATVRLMVAANDSIVGGALTDDKGKFSIKNIPSGAYMLEMASIGYAAKIAGPLRLGPDKASIDLGRIGLKPSTTLDDVVIAEEKDFMINKIDRKVYDVSRNLVSTGGDAQDVLNTIPSVEVDLDGNVALRGNQSVTILVDGKPSGLTGSGRQAILDQIPASTIAKIEVITNPSARFDPDGVSGIINIVTKKNKKAGFNGNTTLSIGTRDKYDAAVGLNYRTAKFNAFGNYSWRLVNRWSEGVTDRTTFLQDTTFRLFQDENGDRRNQSHVVSGGMDLFLTPKATFGFSGNFSVLDELSSETIRFFNYAESGQLDNRFDRIAIETEDGGNYQGEVFFQQTFEQPGRLFSARASYNAATELEDGTYGSYPLDLYGNPVPDAPSLQNNLTDENFNISVFQADYEMPLGENGKLETGAKSILRTIDNDFGSETFSEDAGVFLEDVLLGNRFIYKEQVHALYGTYGRSFGALSLQAGIRAEQALTNSELVTTEETFEYNYFNVFPSGFLAWKPDDLNEIRLSYSRRINRPSTRQLNPFTDYSDPANLRFGNPYLRPEYVNSFDFSYARKVKGGTFTGSAYYRRTLGLHTRLLTITEDGVAARTFENASFADDIGLEAILQVRPLKWWDLTLSGNVVQTFVNASNIEPDLTAQAIAGSARIVTSARSKKGSSVQIMGNYRSPRIRPQGRIGAFFFVDAAVKQEILKGKGDIGLRVSDIFDTLRFQIEASGTEFDTFLLRDRESRIGFLSFSYRFGKEDKGKPGRGGRGGGGGGGMDFDL